MMQRRYDLKFNNITEKLFSHIKVNALGSDFIDLDSITI